NVERAVLAYPAIMRFVNTNLSAGNGNWTKMSPCNHHLILAESQRYIIDPTNPRRALNDGVEHRLHIRGRAADDAEYLTRCRLMLQRLAQFGVALLQFLEQSHIFNRNHRLVGESFEESYLLFAKGSNLRAANMNRTNRNIFTHQWYSQYGPNAYS